MSGVVGDDGRELTGLGGFESASEKGLDYRQITHNDLLLNSCMHTHTHMGLNSYTRVYRHLCCAYI